MKQRPSAERVRPRLSSKYVRAALNRIRHICSNGSTFATVDLSSYAFWIVITWQVCGCFNFAHFLRLQSEMLLLFLVMSMASQIRRKVSHHFTRFTSRQNNLKQFVSGTASLKVGRYKLIKIRHLAS